MSAIKVNGNHIDTIKVNNTVINCVLINGAPQWFKSDLTYGAPSEGTVSHLQNIGDCYVSDYDNSWTYVSLNNNTNVLVFRVNIPNGVSINRVTLELQGSIANSGIERYDNGSKTAALGTSTGTGTIIWTGSITGGDNTYIVWQIGLNNRNGSCQIRAGINDKSVFLS